MITSLLLALALNTAAVPPVAPMPTVEAELPTISELFEEPLATASGCFRTSGASCTTTCADGYVAQCPTNWIGSCTVCPGVYVVCGRTIDLCF